MGLLSYIYEHSGDAVRNYSDLYSQHGLETVQGLFRRIVSASRKFSLLTDSAAIEHRPDKKHRLAAGLPTY